MFYSLSSIVHPRYAVIGLYTADWAVDETPKFRRLVSLSGKIPIESARHIAIFQIEPIIMYDAAFMIIPGNGPAQADKVFLLGGPREGRCLALHLNSEDKILDW